MQGFIAGILRQVNPFPPTEPVSGERYAVSTLLLHTRDATRYAAVHYDRQAILELLETRMKTLFALLMSSAFVVLAGCNTVAGAGKDMEQGGQKVQDTAKDVQNKM